MIIYRNNLENENIIVILTDPTQSWLEDPSLGPDRTFTRRQLELGEEDLEQVMETWQTGIGAGFLPV